VPHCDDAGRPSCRWSDLSGWSRLLHELAIGGLVRGVAVGVVDLLGGDTVGLGLPVPGLLDVVVQPVIASPMLMVGLARRPLDQLPAGASSDTSPLEMSAATWATMRSVSSYTLLFLLDQHRG
jgi:hypothetical protein